MKTVQRANKQLRVADDRLDEMLKSGYVEVDGKTGRPLAVPDVDGDMKKENAALKKENKDLKAQVKELAAQVKAQMAEGKPEN